MAAWLADGGGPDRQRLYLDLLKEAYGRVWLTQTAQTPLAQLWALLMEPSGPAAAPPDPTDYPPQCAADVAAWANARRAKQGLPPVKFV